MYALFSCVIKLWVGSYMLRGCGKGNCAMCGCGTVFEGCDKYIRLVNN